MHLCMWATVEVQNTQTAFERCKRRAANSVIKKSTDYPNKWIGQMVTGGNILYLTNESLNNSNQKRMYSVIRFCALVENVPLILKQQGFWKKIESTVLLKAGTIDRSATSQVNLWNSYGRSTWVKHQWRFSGTSRRCWKEKAFNRFSSKAGSSSCHCKLKNQYESVCLESAERIAAFVENFKPGRWSFLGRGDSENGTEA